MPSMVISRRAPVNQQRAELVCRIVTVTKAWLSSSAPGLGQGSPRRCFL